MEGSGFAVVSTAREFSQIRLIAALIITVVLCWDWKAYACNRTHKPTQEKGEMSRLNSLLRMYPLSPVWPHNITGPCATLCVSDINGKMAPWHVNHFREEAQNNPHLTMWQSDGWNWKCTGKPTFTSLFFSLSLSLSHIHTDDHTHICVSHACRRAISSLVKSTTKVWAGPHHYEYNERSLAPQVHTQSAPRPAPLPPLSHTPHTHTQWPL